MPTYICITGQRFGRLIALEPVKLKPKQMHWRCRCDCGGETVVLGHKLRWGRTQSCGCLASDILIARSTIHGHTPRGNHHPLYASWFSMIQRCYNPKNKSYYRYGGRGIGVCERWRGSFADFLADMGERPPGLSLDRINNELGYSAENCRWSTPKEQANNRGGKRTPKGSLRRSVSGSDQLRRAPD